MIFNCLGRLTQTDCPSNLLPKHVFDIEEGSFERGVDSMVEFHRLRSSDIWGSGTPLGNVNLNLNPEEKLDNNGLSYTKKELAAAALDTTDSVQFSFYNMLLNGNEGKGFLDLLDVDGVEGLSIQELESLAAKDGDPGMFSSKDFESFFADEDKYKANPFSDDPDKAKESFQRILEQK